MRGWNCNAISNVFADGNKLDSYRLRTVIEDVVNPIHNGAIFRQIPFLKHDAVYMSFMYDVYRDS